MSIIPSPLPRRVLARLGTAVCLALVVGLLPSVANSMASAQSSDDTTTTSSSSLEATTSSSVPESTTSTVASSTTSSTATSSEGSIPTDDASTTNGPDPALGADDTTDPVGESDAAPATDDGAPTDSNATATSSDETIPGATPSTIAQVDGAPLDDVGTDPTGDGSAEPSSADEADEADEADGATEAPESDEDSTTPTDGAAGVDPADATGDDELDNTGDGTTIISEKLEPLPGFTGGGAVISSNPIRRLGGGWYEQPVMVIGRNATAEIEAAIRDAEQQGSADARALVEVQTRISELTEANGIDVDDVEVSTDPSAITSEALGTTGTDVSTDAEDAANAGGLTASSNSLSDGATEAKGEVVLSASELARRSAWQAVLDDSRSRIIDNTSSRGIAIAERNAKRAVLTSATERVSRSETLVQTAEDNAKERVTAERDARARADEAAAASLRAQARVAAASRTVTRYTSLVADARSAAVHATDDYEERRLSLQAVAVAWYVGSEALAGDARDLVEATTAGNRVEVGRVEALSLLDDRRALLETATEQLTASQALLSNRTFALREAGEALAESTDAAVAGHTAERVAIRAAESAERSKTSALAELAETQSVLDVDRRRLAIASRESDEATARIETIAGELISAREAYITASIELGRPVSDAELAILDASHDDHDHFAEPHESGDAETDPAGSGGETDDPTPASQPSSTSSTSSTEPRPTTEELAALAAADAAAKAEEERLAAEEERLAAEAAERATEVAERREQAEAEIAALKAQAQELTNRRGLAPSALRSLLNSSSVTFPIAGSWNFIDSWGFPRSGGRRHKGSDIFAPMGTPLVAIEDGRVSAKTNNLGGNVVYLYGDSGNTYYYAHLSAFHPRASAGGRIKAGEVLGFVGTSGNARGTPPHLHIGLKGPGTSAINPYPLMRALSEAVVAEQRRGARASVSPFVMSNLSADVIAQLVAEGVPLLPSVVDALPPNVKADLAARGLI